MFYLWELGFQAWDRVGDIVRQSWEILCSSFVLVPFADRGIRMKKSTPSVGWEVPVKSHRSTSKSCTKSARQWLRAVTLGYDTHDFILHGRLLLILRFHFCTFYCVKKSVLLSIFNQELKIIIALWSLHWFDLLGHWSLIAMNVMFVLLIILRVCALSFFLVPRSSVHD